VHLRSSGVLAGGHPVVRDRQLRDLFLLGLSVVIPTVLALAIVIELPSGSTLAVLGVIVGVLGIVYLMVSTRLEFTVALLAVYLGLLDGPVKLSFGGHEVLAAVPDVLIIAVCLGAVMRIVVRRESIKMPPMSAWVVAFVGVVAIEAFNPNTTGILKVAAGFRQQLQFVPFFFFGYYLLRTKANLRKLFIIAGVIALANGVIAGYQSTLQPAQLASWGPGYHNLIYVNTAEGAVGTGRTFVSEGEARVRPPGLGSDAGFGAGVGQIAFPFCLALLAISRRRRWIAVLLCLGSLLAIVDGLGRSQVIGAGFDVMAFVGLAMLARRRVTRALTALAAIVLIGIPVGYVVVSTLRPGTFQRYETINVTSSSTDLHKESAWKLIPHYLAADPFGFGLGSVGPTSGIGGRNAALLEGHSVSSETQYNFIVNELGAPGLVVWTALSIYMLLLIPIGMTGVRDGDLAILLAGFFAPFFALFIEASSGSFTLSAAAGPYFWLSIGVAAYWFMGPGRQRARLNGDAHA